MEEACEEEIKKRDKMQIWSVSSHKKRMLNIVDTLFLAQLQVFSKL